MQKEKAQVILITSKFNAIATYLSPGRLESPESPGWPFKHEVNSLTLHLSLFQKILFAFLGLFDSRYWRGNRNDTMYYLRLVRATSETVYFSHSFKIILSWGPGVCTYNLMDWGRFEPFGLPFHTNLSDDIAWYNLIAMSLLLVFSFRYVRSIYRNQELTDLNNIRVYGIQRATLYAKESHI